MEKGKGKNGSTRRSSLHSFVRTMRQAAYRSERKPPAWKALGFGRRVKALGVAVALAFAPIEPAVAACAHQFSILRPVLRPFAELFWFAGHLVWRTLKAAKRLSTSAIIGLANSLIALLFSNRKTIRSIIRRWFPEPMNLITGTAGLGAMRMSQHLIERRIPIASGVIRRMVELGVTMIMSGEMAAGNIGNTLMLARVANLSFRPYIQARKRHLSFLYFQAMFHARRYDRIVREAPNEEKLNNHYMNYIVGVSHLYSGQPETARFYLQQALSLNDKHYQSFRMLGRTSLLLGDEDAAARSFKMSVQLLPSSVMAHQNYAGRYDIPNYKPKEWELQGAERLLFYDNYGQLAEEMFLIGNFEMSFRCYQKMLDFQSRYYRQYPLPKAKIERLTRGFPRFDPSKPIRILPYEWVTQFGHIALLDSYFKMARLGMYPDANYVLLAPKEKVVNSHYLNYWDDFFIIVRDEDLVNDLFPYQRLLGDNFMAYPGTDGAAEPWTRAAARAHVEWAQQGRAPLLVLSEEDLLTGLASLQKLGIPEGSWFVGLHVREGGYYGESAGGMSTHRNAQITDYLPAIKAITDAGGYVVRLGDRSMRRLEPTPGLIDYALSDEKSPAMDIFFCATSRFVIGTTSGLTTACISFGTPMLLVNCVSNDWQLWSGNTDFIFKPIRNMREKRILSVSEAFTQPVQGYLINNHTMRRNGLVALPNTAAEIEEAVRYKLASFDGPSASIANATEPMRAYWKAMSGNPMMFGAASPVVPFLERHPELTLASKASTTLSGRDEIGLVERV